MKGFETINKAYSSVFKPGQLSIGLVVPIENYAHSSLPSLHNHLERVHMIEKLGFKALWIRDVPMHVPSFGDAGQTFDPFTYLGYLAGQTREIALGIASIALPLHHPVHVAKSVATIDQLSGGRVLLGVASGDRPIEYPAMGIDFERRGDLFREAFAYIRQANLDFPSLPANHWGKLDGQVDILPKASSHKIPMLITGHSRQSLDWNAQNGDGWMYYPRNFNQQKAIIDEWRGLVAQKHQFDKPFMQPLYIDLHEDDFFLPQPIHLGFKLGSKHLLDYFHLLQKIGVNHVAVNLRFSTGPIEHTLERLAQKILPHFHQSQTQTTAT